MLTRCLYAVDASIYRVEPAAVAFPRSAVEAANLLRVAAESGVEITPRGAGTGLAGGALGSGLVVDFARHSRRISEFDAERRTVRVGAGVVLDQLNDELAPHGMWFGPDVATSSRATLGGMIANNSSGAHAPVYGTTAEHVEALEIVLADGTVAVVGRDSGGLEEIRDAADAIVAEHTDAINERLPEGLFKRWPGYGLDRALRSPGDLTQLVAGSEGTLAGIASAILRVVPKPHSRFLGILFFQSVMEALQSTVELGDLGAAAIEHLDRAALDQTAGKRAFAAARALLQLDEKPCEALLLVEFFDDDAGLDDLERRGLGVRRLLCRDPAEQELAWGLRRAGLSLLTSRAGAAKPWGFIEDVCVRPERLPEYVMGLREIFEPLGLEASFYGHAASGELHVRPVLDLHTAGDIVKLRQVADQVSDLCRRFRGSLTAEHGVGLARTEYVEAQLGPELVDANRRLKVLFDPGGVLNPGKIIDDGRYRIDRDLRLGEGSEIRLPFEQAFAWIGRDDGFVANLEQCNGCGGCLKKAPTMCPTFSITHDEALSTRGRANTIRAALEGRFDHPSPLAAAELSEVLSSCLSCKACITECPSNVDMAQLKAELIHARHREQGAPLIDRLISASDLLGRLGTLMPGLANTMLGWRAAAADGGACSRPRRRMRRFLPSPGNGSTGGSEDESLQLTASAGGSFCGTTPGCATTNLRSVTRRSRCSRLRVWRFRWSPIASAAAGRPRAAGCSTTSAVPPSTTLRSSAGRASRSSSSNRRAGRSLSMSTVSWGSRVPTRWRIAACCSRTSWQARSKRGRCWRRWLVRWARWRCTVIATPRPCQIRRRSSRCSSGCPGPLRASSTPAAAEWPAPSGCSVITVSCLTGSLSPWLPRSRPCRAARLWSRREPAAGTRSPT